jgi:hypothetical protein
MGRKEFGKIFCFLNCYFIHPHLCPPPSMGRKGFEGIFNLHIVNLFTPPLSSPVRWGGWVKMIETDTPTFILPHQWGGWDLMDFLAIVKFFTPTFYLFREIGKMVEKD